MLNHDGRLVTGAELRALGSLVVFFYPRANTPGCTLEAKRFRDEAPAFAAAGATIVGVSQDPPDRQACFAADHSLPFALLCDEKGDLYRAFGLRSTSVSSPAGPPSSSAPMVVSPRPSTPCSTPASMWMWPSARFSA